MRSQYFRNFVDRHLSSWTRENAESPRSVTSESSTMLTLIRKFDRVCSNLCDVRTYVLIILK